MAVLYRTYRPRKFSEVVGQGHVVTTLTNSLKLGRLGHAYLFTGGRGVGKTSIARILAKAVNCLSPVDGDACLSCQICLGIAEENFLDIVEIDAASHTGVENVRELIEHVQFAPAVAKKKVFIIDEVHMLSKAAFNALLKTLEEPPDHVVFILATTEIQKVPVTIVSRTQRFDFSRIGYEEMVGRLSEVILKEGLNIPSEVVGLVAQKSDGGLRDALSLLEKIVGLGNDVTLESVQVLLGVVSMEESQKLLGMLVDKKSGLIPEFFSNLMNSGVDAVIFNRDFLEYLRAVLVYKVSGVVSGVVLSEEQKLVFLNQVDEVTTSWLIHVIRLFLRSLKDGVYGVSPELPMLIAALEVAVGGVDAGVAQASKGVQTLPAVVASESKKEVENLGEVKRFEEVVRAKKNESINKIESSGGAFDDVSLDEVKLLWNSVISSLKLVNSPLATLVKSSPIVSVEKGVVTVAANYLFHKEHLESTKVYQLIVQTIREVTNKKLGFAVVLVKEEDRAQNIVRTVDDALAVFGGEII